MLSDVEFVLLDNFLIVLVEPGGGSTELGIVPEVPVGFGVVNVSVDEEGFAVGGGGFDGFGSAAVDVAAHVFSFIVWLWLWL